MFTGIIQAVGRIRDNEEIGDGLRIHVEAPELGLDTVKIGDSIAINGACMTVVEVDEKKFKVEVSAESLSKTAGLDGWGYVNLEKAMRLGDRLDGHIVSGHVDGVGEVDAFEKVAESYRLVVRCPMKLAKFLAYKGSVAINGVSLTINEVEACRHPHQHQLDSSYFRTHFLQVHQEARSGQCRSGYGCPLHRKNVFAH